MEAQKQSCTERKVGNGAPSKACNKQYVRPAPQPQPSADSSALPKLKTSVMVDAFDIFANVSDASTQQNRLTRKINIMKTA